MDHRLALPLASGEIPESAGREWAKSIVREAAARGTRGFLKLLL
jgi:hypothetical protein